MRAVVTGGAGFIGSSVVDALAARGATVLVVDNLSSGARGNLTAASAAGVQLAALDIRDGQQLGEEIVGFGPDVVFHLAAQADVRVSMADPSLDASVNVLGSVNVFAAALRAGARVVNTSTGGAIYGADAPLPTDEEVEPQPISAYGLSKLTAERYARWFTQAHGLRVVTLRYGNVYGPRQDPAGDAGVIALFCDRARTGRRPIVFGDGSQTRDFVYVGDVVGANLAAAERELPHPVYNVGTGVEISVLQLVAAVAAAANLDPQAFLPEFAASRAGELDRSCLDATLGRGDLGLGEPIPLVEGLRTTMAWFAQRT